MSLPKSKHKKITFHSGPEKTFRTSDRPKTTEGSEEQEEPSYIAHLQPEILPIELMKSLLLTRGAKDEIQKEECKEKIIQLFYKHITPKPQRVYRENRRGKVLTHLRKKREKITNVKEEYKIMDVGKSNKLVQSSSDNSKEIDASSLSSENRLKRPISCVDPEKKTIKLNKSSKASLDTIHIIDKSKDSKKVSSNDTKSDLEKREPETTEITQTKKIKLSRSTDPSKLESTKIEEEKSKKKTPISWP